MTTKQQSIKKICLKLNKLSYEQKEDVLYTNLNLLTKKKLKEVEQNLPIPANEKVSNLYCDQFFPVNNVSIFNVFPNKCGVENCNVMIRTVNKWMGHLKNKHKKYKIENSQRYESLFYFLFVTKYKN